VCHSDLHIQEGYYDLGGGEFLSFKERVKFPFTSGHETAGEVTQLGPNASGVKLGAAFGSWVAVVGQGGRLVVVELLVGKCLCRCHPCKR